MLTTAIPDKGLLLYRTYYAVRSAITATDELLVYFAITCKKTINPINPKASHCTCGEKT